MKKVAAVFLLMLFAGQASASIIYNVNRTIGDGTVTGTIETDGTLGSIFLGNITNVNLVMQTPGVDGGAIQNFSHFYSAGAAFIATANELLFDFTDGTTGGYTIAWFQSSLNSSSNFWCLDQANCAGYPGSESLGYDDNGTSYGYVSEIEFHTGLVAIASTGGTVPAPGALALFALGLLGLASCTLARARRS